jgi:hypothetical protein
VSDPKNGARRKTVFATAARLTSVQTPDQSAATNSETNLCIQEIGILQPSGITWRRTNAVNQRDRAAVRLRAALPVGFQEVVHSVLAGKAEVVEASVIRGGPNEHPQECPSDAAASSARRCGRAAFQSPGGFEMRGDAEVVARWISPIWLHHYNWHRPHGSLKSKPPISRLGLTEDNLLRLHI